MDGNGAKNFKDFLERLRASDETTKRKIIIITSIICMIVIIYVWLGYFNSIVSGGAQPAPVASASSAPSANFWQSVQSSTNALYGKLSGEFNALLNGSKYKIQPSH